MYLNDVDPRNEQFEEERSTGGFDNTTGTFTVKENVYGNLFNKQNRTSINFLKGRESNTNVQSFIKEKNKLAPLLPDYKPEPIITDWKDSPEEKNNTNNTNNTIYGLPKMVVYGGGAVLTLAVLYFILKD